MGLLFSGILAVTTRILVVDSQRVSKSPKEIRVPDKPFHPYDSYVFPKRVLGKQNQFCNSKLFKLYPRLDYDKIKDSATYYFCNRHYSKLKGNDENYFMSAGCLDWKHAFSLFDEYQAASYHRLAVNYEVIVPQCRDVKEIQNTSSAYQMELNRQCLEKIVKTLQFLARQKLALRGDNSDYDSNFTLTLKLCAKDISQLTDWMKRKPKNYEPWYLKRNNSDYCESNNPSYNSKHLEQLLFNNMSQVH